MIVATRADTTATGNAKETPPTNINGISGSGGMIIARQNKIM